MAETVSERAHGVANSLLSELSFRTMSDSREIYVYDPARGIYINSADRVIESRTESIIGVHTTRNLVFEVSEVVRRRTFADRSDFDVDDNVLVVRNGVLDLSTGNCMPHSPDYLALRSVAVGYDPTATCPAIDRFLNDVLSPHDRDVFGMFLGYLLLPDNRFKKALVLVGPRDTGKTTLISLIMGLLGESNVCGESLQDLCDNRFSSSALPGKMANIRDDLGAVELKNAEKLKELTGNFSQTRGEKKNMPSFLFKNRAKFIFTCNLLPPASKADSVYYNRWIIVEMRKRFVLGGRGATGRVARPGLVGELISESEMSGFLNLALRGRARLIANNGFVELPDDIGKMRYLAFAGDSVGRFISDSVLVGPDFWAAKAGFASRYVKYCSLRGEPSKSAGELHAAIRAVFPESLERVTRVDGQVVRILAGIGLRDEAEVEAKIEDSYPISLKPSEMSGGG